MKLKEYKSQKIKVLLDSGFKVCGKVMVKKGTIGLDTKEIFYYESAINKVLE